MEGLQRFGGGIARELLEQRSLAVRSLGVVYQTHPGGNSGANFKSISHRCYLREVAFEWELTKEIIYLPLDYLQGGKRPPVSTQPWSSECGTHKIVKARFWSWRSL